MEKQISFETLKEICMHKNTDVDNSNECIEQNNFSGECSCIECPIWNELSSSEIEF